MEGVYSFADIPVCVCSLYEEVQTLCAEYRTDAAPQIRIVTAQEDLQYERERAAAEEQREGLPHREYPAPYLETLSVYRKAAEELLWHGILLFHGSVIAVDGKAYLFTARSGTGKSTHTGFWRALFGERAVMVNDDKPLLRITENGVLAYGTPWDGKHHLSCRIAVPLVAICLLERAPENQIHEISVAEAYPMLVQQSFHPKSATAMKQVLCLIDHLSMQVKPYRMGCLPNLDAAKIAYEAMCPTITDKGNTA